jgi:dihydropteroate synthase
MGIVNVTPDSFSDGGKFSATSAAVDHGLRLVDQGTDLLDIGGESTRPGATPVPLEEEFRRVIPVIEQLAARTTVPISVDTSKSGVAAAALSAGARIVNDVTALAGDPAMPELVQRTRAGAIMMHMQGTPATMQLAPHYNDVIAEILTFFETRLRALTDFGLARKQLVLDPGIGFGKTRDHNLELLARLDEFQRLGRPICLGVSRKGFFGSLLNRPVDRRLAASVAAVLFAQSLDAAQIVRVHDVEETRDAVQVFETLRSKRLAE